MTNGERGLWIAAVSLLLGVLISLVIAVLLELSYEIRQLERKSHTHDTHRELPK